MPKRPSSYPLQSLQQSSYSHEHQTHPKNNKKPHLDILEDSNLINSAHHTSFQIISKIYLSNETPKAKNLRQQAMMAQLIISHILHSERNLPLNSFHLSDMIEIPSLHQTIIKLINESDFEEMAKNELNSLFISGTTHFPEQNNHIIKDSLYSREKKLIYCPSYSVTQRVFLKLYFNQNCNLLEGTPGISKTFSASLFHHLTDKIVRYFSFIGNQIATLNQSRSMSTVKIPQTIVQLFDQLTNQHEQNHHSLDHIFRKKVSHQKIQNNINDSIIQEGKCNQTELKYPKSPKYPLRFSYFQKYCPFSSNEPRNITIEKVIYYAISIDDTIEDVKKKMIIQLERDFEITSDDKEILFNDKSMSLSKFYSFSNVKLEFVCIIDQINNVASALRRNYDCIKMLAKNLKDAEKTSLFGQHKQRIFHIDVNAKFNSTFQEIISMKQKADRMMDIIRSLIPFFDRVSYLSSDNIQKNYLQRMKLVPFNQKQNISTKKIPFWNHQSKIEVKLDIIDFLIFQIKNKFFGLVNSHPSIKSGFKKLNKTHKKILPDEFLISYSQCLQNEPIHLQSGSIDEIEDLNTSDNFFLNKSSLSNSKTLNNSSFLPDPQQIIEKELKVKRLSIHKWFDQQDAYISHLIIRQNLSKFIQEKNINSAQEIVKFIQNIENFLDYCNFNAIFSLKSTLKMFVDSKDNHLNVKIQLLLMIHYQYRSQQKYQQNNHNHKENIVRLNDQEIQLRVYQNHIDNRLFDFKIEHVEKNTKSYQAKIGFILPVETTLEIIKYAIAQYKSNIDFYMDQLTFVSKLKGGAYGQYLEDKLLDFLKLKSTKWTWNLYSIQNINSQITWAKSYEMNGGAFTFLPLPKTYEKNKLKYSLASQIKPYLQKIKQNPLLAYLMVPFNDKKLNMKERENIILEGFKVENRSSNNPCIDFILVRINYVDNQTTVDIDAFDFTTDPSASPKKIENFINNYVNHFIRYDTLEHSSKLININLRYFILIPQKIIDAKKETSLMNSISQKLKYFEPQLEIQLSQSKNCFNIGRGSNPNKKSKEVQILKTVGLMKLQNDYISNDLNSQQMQGFLRVFKNAQPKKEYSNSTI